MPYSALAISKCINLPDPFCWKPIPKKQPIAIASFNTIYARSRSTAISQASPSVWTPGSFLFFSMLWVSCLYQDEIVKGKLHLILSCVIESKNLGSYPTMPVSLQAISSGLKYLLSQSSTSLL